MTGHSLPAIFSKSTLPTSTRVRPLPIRDQVGCRLLSREDPLQLSWPTVNHEKIYNLFSSIEFESVTSICQE